MLRSPNPGTPRSSRLSGLPALWLPFLAFFLLAAHHPAPAQLVISEFLADNQLGRKDGDGDAEDWIEIFNTSSSPVSLAGWSLTDSASQPRKWDFPDVSLPSRGFLLVFASGKDRRVAGQALHTNFRLAAEGEYLALIRPDLQPATEFAPAYPRQFTDVSFGFPTESVPVSLLPVGAPGTSLIPTNDDLGSSWFAPEFDDSTWTPITTGVGVDPLGTLSPHIRTPLVQGPIPSPSVYLRLAFAVTNVADLADLSLNARYNDGFVAFLNGYPILDRNAPVQFDGQDPDPGLRWNSTAILARTPQESVTLESITIDGARDRLVLGTNVLAFQVLNSHANDPTLLFAPELTARSSAFQHANPLFFSSPSPALQNSGGVQSLGPVIDSVTHAPSIPRDDQDVVVTAHIRPTLRPIASVQLLYRVMYTAQVSLPMHDDGQQGDGAAGDGVWTARIPASAATPGQMIRWIISATDTAQVTMRHPRYPDPRRSPQYLGTIVHDPSLADSRIPVLHWFIQSPGAADSDTGSRGSLFFDGEFYDNVGANLHGQSTRSFPKKSYDFDFNPGFKFRWREGQPRVDDFNLLTTWADKSHLRNVLAYETYAQAGAMAHFAIPVRVQQNARFFSVANLVENGDDNFLERLGLDPRGALYKMYNVADSTAGAEKKTRKTEGTQDLAALIGGLNAGSTQARQAFLFDNLDIPGVVNYLATRALTGDNDCCHKNYYLYRDSDGSREWLGLPWDVDLSFGRVWTCGSPCLAYYDETVYTNTGLFVGNNNVVFSAVLNNSATRPMYLRRLRTLADELAQPPGTPPDQDRWRLRASQLRDLLAPDAARDLAKWGTWGRRETITQAVDRIHNEFLPGRRNYLFNTLTRSGTLPPSQPQNAVIRFARIEARPASGNRFHEFLELTNANTYAVDLSDWRIDGPVQFHFKPGTVLPARSNAFVSPDRRQFRARTVSPKGAERRLVLGDYDGELDARGGMVTLLDPRLRVVHTAAVPADPSPAQSSLRITELMIQPAGSDDASAAEFIELQNIGATPLDLTGLRFTIGVTFDFSNVNPTVRTLAAGQRVLVVSNLDVFQARYGVGLNIAGAYEGQLDNAGERLRLEDASGEPILDFTFDLAPFPQAAGLGYSLVIRDPSASPETWNQPGAWRPSTGPGGSPGVDEPDPPAPILSSVVINEVLAHASPPLVDAVELHNPSSVPADISGWWLTDDPSQPQKFRVPPGTVLPPGGFRVFDESHFAPPGNAPTNFRFSAHGDDVWLFGTRADGSFSGYTDGFEFPASADGVSFGRFTNSTGEVQFPVQRSRTFGAPNTEPAVGPVVLSEILASPRRGEDPFIEIKNITASTVPLFDPAHPQHRWRIGGVTFDFPAGFTLPAGGLAVIVGGDPTTFRLRYAVPSAIPVLGPWPGTLQPDGERLSLERPDAPDVQPDGTTVLPYLVVDAVRFRDQPPWPVPASAGTSLERLRPDAHGDDPSNWRTSPIDASPGYDLGPNRPPFVTAGIDVALEADRYPVSILLGGFASDDGLPSDPGRITTTWSQVSGAGVLEFADVHRTNSIVLVPSPDRYTVRLTAFDGASSNSADVFLDVRRPGSDPIVIPAGSAWRYFAADRAPAAAWSTVAFDDRTWPQGEAELGYGDGNEATVIPDTVNGTKVFTAYFRRTFQVANPARVQSLNARLLRDDGAALWLNGSIVHRSNLPNGPLAFSTPAIETIAGADESTFIDIPLNASALQQGTNVLAVEVHQQNASSSDLSFDLELQIHASPDTSYDAWRAEHFTATELLDPSVSGDLADPDLDGLSNLDEYRSGTDPRDAQSVLRLTAQRGVEGGIILRAGIVAGRAYRLEWRSEAHAGTWQLLRSIDPQATNQTLTFTDPEAPLAGAARFYRLTTSETR